MTRKQQSSSEKDKSIIWKLPLLLLPLLVLFYLPYNNYISDVIFPFTIAIALIYVSFKKIQNFDLSKKWKTCQGTLLYTRVGVDNPYAQELVRSYYPYIKYSYIVKKNTYISEKVGHYRELRSSKEEIEKLIDQLTSSGVQVYYNPHKVTQSVLLPIMPLHRRIFWIFLLLLGLVALLISFISFRNL